MRTKTFTFCLLLGIICLFACSKKAETFSAPTLPSQLYSYDEQLPNEFGFSQNLPEEFNAQATLGRVLFYDTKLSLNSTVSCGTCHKAGLGFADGKASSVGFGAESTPRNASHLVNVGLQNQFFWDSRANNLQDQVIMPIENHVEMGINDFNHLTEKLEQFDYYGPLFSDAFGTEEISKGRIAVALSSFLQSMISYESKWDAVRIGETTFTAQELRGEEIFNESGCVNCHGGLNFDGWGSSTAVIGLDQNPTDLGAGTWAGEQSNGAFKIPSLRNVALTGPYMHDGRFQSLEEVIEHYNEGIEDVSNLDWRLTDGEFNTTFLDNDILIDIDFASLGGDPIQLNLSDDDQAALVQFLNTLTDQNFLRNPKYQDPF